MNTLLCCGDPSTAKDTLVSGHPTHARPGLCPPEHRGSQSEVISGLHTHLLLQLNWSWSRSAHLSRGYVVFERVNGETEDVVIVAEVEPLAVLGSVVDDGDGGHVVQQLPSLTVEKVVTTVKASIAAKQENLKDILNTSRLNLVSVFGEADQMCSANKWTRNLFLPMNKLQAKPLLWSFLSLQRTNKLLPELWQILLIHLQRATPTSGSHSSHSCFVMSQFKIQEKIRLKLK